MCPLFSCSRFTASFRGLIRRHNVVSSRPRATRQSSCLSVNLNGFYISADFDADIESRFSINWTLENFILTNNRSKACKPDLM